MIATIEAGLLRVPLIIGPARDGVDYLIVCQLGDATEAEIKSYDAFAKSELKRADVEVWFIAGRGLSKSRNFGLNVAKGELVLICDDDIELIPDFDAVIKEAFAQNSEAAAITFQISTPAGLPYKSYCRHSFEHSKRTLAKVSSIEIAVRTNLIRASKITFNERFGLGSEFPTGEEFVFLNDCLKANLKLVYYPAVIVVHPAVSSGQRFNPKLLEAKGALFKHVFGVSFWMANVAFALKKLPLYRNQMSLMECLSYLFSGSARLK